MASNQIADQIKANLPDGARPMDILRAIENRPDPAPRIDPQRIADEVKAERDALAKVEPAAPEVIPPKEEVRVAPVSEPISPIIEEEEKGSIAANYKLLKSTHSETKKALKEKEEAFTKTAQELEDIKTGKVLPEYVFSKEQELERLRGFEKLHSLKTSKEYNDKFIIPINEVKSKLYALGKEYEIPDDVMDEAINITDRRELNRFVENHFDLTDAIQAKDYISNVRSLTEKARGAELEPAKMLKDLEEEGQAIQIQKRAQLKTVLGERQQRAWTKSLELLRSEGKAIELIPRADDSEFNKTYVEPLLQAAGAELSKFVSKIESKLGEPIDEEEMFFLARMTQLAHASAVSMETRNRALTAADELLATSQRTARFVRPPVGSQGAPGTGAPAQKRETTEDRMNTLLETGRANAKR